ncbi:hypothetical protein EEL32_06165 [Brevibacillus laterosporus]|uniref:Uncharacterized protein n=1 Tax=Brevibacillus laterosporus TaxID=1465 RepID=A0A502HI37_BRELA|nr:hypothetical protein [Brevibacillus laterosporus]QDX93670.1 hypothetical protein EEL30_16030 [Brevibacillus laterosporus]TPG73335.1 hypothetical protein EEL31_02925 [Brevibacillus laterosporus]TPG89689.1 hypothetical protein EEL32_06165 [Brevibacillus laterosporus]
MNSSTVLLLSCIAIMLPLILHDVFFLRGVKLLEKHEIVRLNYQEEMIPTGCGWFLFFYITSTYVLLSLLFFVRPSLDIPWKFAVFFLCGSFAIAALGWQDDCTHDKYIKGFRGHLGALVTERRMTSGFLKAWAGGNISLIICLGLYDTVFEVLFHTILLALSINLINLFDLRPGRASKVFLLLFILVLVATPLFSVPISWVFVYPIISATLLLFYHDAKRMVMLGDTGSNYLGFILGYTLICTTPLKIKIVFFFVFLVLHVLAERYSFTTFIRDRPLLHKLDLLGGKKAPPIDSEASYSSSSSGSRFIKRG